MPLTPKYYNEIWTIFVKIHEWLGLVTCGQKDMTAHVLLVFFLFGRSKRAYMVDVY